VERPSPELVLQFTLRDKNDRNAPVAGTAQYLGDDGTLAAAASSAERDFTTPLLVQSARHAVAIARGARAIEFAPAEWREVDVKLVVLEQIWPERRNDPSKFAGVAREVVRLADHTRRVGTQRADSAAAHAARLATAARLAQAADEVEAAQRRKAEAERDAALARAYADSVRAEAARTLRYADSVRAAAEAAQQEAEAARQERDAARARLAGSISAIMDTRREARGLVVNLSDVLFTSGQAVLQPGARENLSKLSGILLAYPGPYTLAIGGHTDSVGSDALNDKLSQARAESVRDYLLEAGITAARITSVRGYGKRQPVADNATADGRAKNRRVELVIDDAAE
jgi:outer membrane protein OmpA-like peptidoglycan-associated protein